MQEITKLIEDVNASYQRIRVSDLPEDAKLQAGRWVRNLVGELYGLAWSLNNCPERWS
ncbi:hypothetical protein ACFWY9_29720 [Amycolatopsis sp. NPDC059027]|uniref:hypothetical protein n=1 Tax=Amycolatopsis sp. NPDC059027 TaxID=3346709 RepID=UPI003670D3A4